MKRFRIVLLAIFSALLIFPAASQAQRNVVKFDLLGPMQGRYQFAYERAFFGKMSFQVAAGYLARETNFSLVDGNIMNQFTSQMNGVTFTPELRVYLRKCSPRGLYLRGYGTYTNTSEMLRDLTANNIANVSFDQEDVTLSAGAGLGLHLILLRFLSIDANIGPEWRNLSVTRNYVDNGVSDQHFLTKFPDMLDVNHSGLGIKGNISVGIAF